MLTLLLKTLEAGVALLFTQRISSIHDKKNVASILDAPNKKKEKGAN